MMISVIIPLYNKATGIQRALDSVLAQKFQHFEIIVIDDGSTDESVTIVQKYIDLRIKIIRQVNSGVSSARDYGIQSAGGNLVAFLDADDEWKPNILETLVALSRRFPHAGAYATAYEIQDANGKVFSPPFYVMPQQADGGFVGDFFKAALFCHPLWTSAVMVPKTIMTEVGGFPVDVRIGEDIDTWFRIAARYPIAWSPMPSSIYHQSRGSACKDKLYVGDVAVARSYEICNISNRISAQQKTTMQRLIALYRLYDYIAFNWLTSETRLARQLLRKCGYSPSFWRRWILMFVTMHLPRSYALLMLKLKGLINCGHFDLSPSARIYRQWN
jgi:glycosyltransferase involved in cell wall biosynthesis